MGIAQIAIGPPPLPVVDRSWRHNLVPNVAARSNWVGLMVTTNKELLLGFLLQRAAPKDLVFPNPHRFVALVQS